MLLGLHHTRNVSTIMVDVSAKLVGHDLANAGWEYMAKAASKPARLHNEDGTLTDIVANLKRGEL